MIFGNSGRRCVTAIDTPGGYRPSTINPPSLSLLIRMHPRVWGATSRRVRTIGELLAMPLAHGAAVSSKVLKRIIGASKCNTVGSETRMRRGSGTN
jgi:hypothetical protein